MRGKRSCIVPLFVLAEVCGVFPLKVELRFMCDTFIKAHYKHGLHCSLLSSLNPLDWKAEHFCFWRHRAQDSSQYCSSLWRKQ